MFERLLMLLRKQCKPKDRGQHVHRHRQNNERMPQERSLTEMTASASLPVPSGRAEDLAHRLEDDLST